MTIPLREFDSFLRVTSWREWYDISRSAFREYTFPWMVSNLVGMSLLLVAIQSPKFSRKAWGFLMILASVVNVYTVLIDPTSYLEFGLVAIPPMQSFIYSKYFAKPAPLVRLPTLPSPSFLWHPHSVARWGGHHRAPGNQHFNSISGRYRTHDRRTSLRATWNWWNHEQ